MDIVKHLKESIDGISADGFGHTTPEQMPNVGEFTNTEPTKPYKKKIDYEKRLKDMEKRKNE